jgi:hypothetical protein
VNASRLKAKQDRNRNTRTSLIILNKINFI